MAYNQKPQSNYKGARPGYTGKPATAGNTGSSDFAKSEPILEKLMRPSKSGKSIATFSTQDEDLVIPANSRVVVTALSEKQIAGLTKAREGKGYKGAVPTHKLVVFAIEEQK
jgi:hypothetical protein